MFVCDVVSHVSCHCERANQFSYLRISFGYVCVCVCSCDGKLTGEKVHSNDITLTATVLSHIHSICLDFFNNFICLRTHFIYATRIERVAHFHTVLMKFHSYFYEFRFWFVIKKWINLFNVFMILDEFLRYRWALYMLFCIYWMDISCWE